MKQSNIDMSGEMMKSCDIRQKTANIPKTASCHCFTVYVN